MSWAIASLIAVIVGVLAFIAAWIAKGEDRVAAIVSGIAFVAAGVLVFVISSITTVGANRVGIITEFGRYQGTIQPGLSMMWPWADVEELPTRIQPLELKDIPVRFEGNSGGTADVLVEWRVEGTDETSMRRLWQDYRTTDAVQDRVVQSNSRNALNVVLAGYTPSRGVSGASLTDITGAALAQIKARLGGTGVIVERITIRQIDPDVQSQERINRQVQAQADLERTETTKEIAKREAEIAATRQTSQTPSSLQYECLRIVGDWNQATQGPMPQTFDCNFGGPAAPVIVGR